MKHFREFESTELFKFEHKMQVDSAKLVEKVIAEKSPAQKGDIIYAIHTTASIEPIWMQITKVSLMSMRGWGGMGELSFYYEGVPLTKQGKPMKNRNPKPVWAFEIGGTRVDCPTYNRDCIGVATMRKTCHL